MAGKPSPEDVFHDHLTLGLMGTLAKIQRVCNVTCEHRKPCDKTQVVNWEQRHSVYLPEDMKKFYLSTDGFLLQWSYQYAADDVRRVGYIHIPHLQQITLLREPIEPNPNMNTIIESSSSIRTITPTSSHTTSSLLTESDGSTGALGGMWRLGSVPTMDSVGGGSGARSTSSTLTINSSPTSNKDRWGHQLPILTTKSKIFELNCVNQVAKVCIIYEASGTNNPKVYLYELNSMKWIFLADTFSEYLRMCIAHLGLPYWELCFSSIGIPSWTEQLFMLLAPHLLEDQPRRERQVELAPEHPYNIIDASIFRTKPRSSLKSTTSKKSIA